MHRLGRSRNDCDPSGEEMKWFRAYVEEVDSFSRWEYILSEERRWSAYEVTLIYKALQKFVHCKGNVGGG
jgi:hypothetical protein